MWRRPDVPQRHVPILVARGHLRPSWAHAEARHSPGHRPIADTTCRGHVPDAHGAVPGGAQQREGVARLVAEVEARHHLAVALEGELGRLHLGAHDCFSLHTSARCRFLLLGLLEHSRATVPHQHVVVPAASCDEGRVLVDGDGLERLPVLLRAQRRHGAGGDTRVELRAEAADDAVLAGCCEEARFTGRARRRAGGDGRERDVGQLHRQPRGPGFVEPEAAVVGARDKPGAGHGAQRSDRRDPIRHLIDLLLLRLAQREHVLQLEHLLGTELPCIQVLEQVCAKELSVDQEVKWRGLLEA
mmetsp:Transcript_61290/g.200424  ORF Transcript_61290/g.200424 Transcript_61290/m.200424 type:complete len:301 (+) Transcript_61290:457-1359(+)